MEYYMKIYYSVKSMFEKSIIANLENRGINITNSSISNSYI